MEDSDIKLRAGINKLKNESRYKECFHGGKSCSSRIIKAHSIQRNRILNKISDNGHVLVFRLSDSVWGFELSETGNAIASTFSGFCNHHDTEIFSPIENFNYSPNDQEQEFLYAYRALAISHNRKHSEKLFYKNLIKILAEKKHGSYGIPIRDQEDYNLHRKDYSTRLRFVEIALKQREKTKIAFNANLQNNRFDSVETEILIFPEEYYIASSSALFIMRDFKGKIINNIYTPKEVNKPLFLSIFPQDGKTYVLMSFLKKERSFFSFTSDIANKNIGMQKDMISKLIVKYSDNFVISPAAWNKLPNDQQERINELLMSSISISEDINSVPNVDLFLK